jgi:hypothetical protein
MRVRWRVWCGLALGVGAPITAAIGCSAPSHGTASDAGVRLGPSSDGGLDPLNEGSTGIEASSVHDAEGGACHPGSLSGFHPPPSVPSTRSLACNGFNGDGGLVQAYGHACIGHAATYASCAAQSATDAATAAACFHCLVSQASPSATDYGPAVVLSVPEVNYPGCLLLLDPTEAGVSCAQAFTSASPCVLPSTRLPSRPTTRASTRRLQARACPTFLTWRLVWSLRWATAARLRERLASAVRRSKPIFCPSRS